MSVDNFSENEVKKVKLILQIQELHNQGVGIREIQRRIGISRGTVKKYLDGDPYVLCRSSHRSELDKYTDYIIRNIQEGKTKSKIADELAEMGYSKSKGNAMQFISGVAKRYGLKVRKYRSVCNDAHQNKETKRNKTSHERITRKGIFNYLWMGGELSGKHHSYLWKEYPVLQEIELCIREFREIFEKKNMSLLYLFVEGYKDSEIKEISSFASGLEKDIEAVENAVASNLSNGFVEGTNNKLKKIKRSMYGRCGKKLLAIKLIFGNLETE